MKEVKVYFDGASRGNPGPSAAGGILMDESGEEIERFSEFLGEGTNNEAEYRAFIEALERASKYKPEKATFYTDSELLYRQIRGEYRVKNDRLRTLYNRAQKLIASFREFDIVHIPREKNSVADELCNLALRRVDEKRTLISGEMQVTVRAKFDVAHHLEEYEGKCAELHGHSYRVELTVAGSQLKNGILIDIVELKKILKSIIDRFDHKYLNELDEFKELNPTAENIAALIAQKAQEKIPAGVRVKIVTVFESDDSWVTFIPR